MSEVSKDGQWQYFKSSHVAITLTKPLTSNVKEGKVEIPEMVDGKRVVKLGYDCFMDCDKLEQVIIPLSVELIYSSCFKNCKRLQSIYLPKNVEDVGSYAFKNCASFKKVYTDGQWIRWGKGCFDGCPITEQDILLYGGCWW